MDSSWQMQYEFDIFAQICFQGALFNQDNCIFGCFRLPLSGFADFRFGKWGAPQKRALINDLITMEENETKK